jgi:nucleotide-binding universal stress UspA family protein
MDLLPSARRMVMYRRILIATDGSELAGKAVAQGLDLARRVGAEAVILTVTEPPGFGTIPAPRFLGAYEEVVAQEAARILQSASEAAMKAGVPCVTLHIKDRYVAEAITATASEQGCSLIVMASHGRRGLSRRLLGSETIKVLTMGTLPVLVCR